MAINHGIVEKMEPDLGKLFIGGISWDTDEDRLKEYFGNYGEVVETVIMRDRLTGRARGFGFVVFADRVVAERVVMEKHVIDGRTVEAKKAVPRDDHHGPNRNNSSNSIQGSPSPGPGRTKKIFVGGLASTVTESDFKNYFDQFGTITDVVVMYDHNTQRPRGFGFITYDSEDAVDRVLHKTFHELSGKMVEVKRAVPKELSPSPNRSPLVGYNYGLGRPNGLLNTTFPQGYNTSSMGSYGVRMDGRFNPINAGRTGLSPFGSPGYGMGLNLDSGLSPNYGGASPFSNNLGYGRVLSPYYNANSNRYSTPIGYNQGNGRSDSFLNSSPRNLWGNGGLANSANSATYLGSGGNGNFGAFGNSGPNWGSSSISAQGGGGGGGGSSGYNSGNAGGYGPRETSYGLGTGGLGRNSGPAGVANPSFATSGGGYDGPYRDFYRGGSMYGGDQTWQSSSPEVDGSGSFGYALDDAADVAVRSSEGYAASYSIGNRQSNRGIAA